MKTLITIISIIFTLSNMGCTGLPENPENRFKTGSYNYTSFSRWGETLASPLSFPNEPRKVGYGILCTLDNYCVSRANDLCSPKSALIISREEWGDLNASRYYRDATTRTWMQILCISQEDKEEMIKSDQVNYDGCEGTWSKLKACASGSISELHSDSDWELNKDIGTYCPNADLGHADAQAYVGDLYYHGKYSLDKDIIQAYVLVQSCRR